MKDNFNFMPKLNEEKLKEIQKELQENPPLKKIENLLQSIDKHLEVIENELKERS